MPPPGASWPDEETQSLAKARATKNLGRVAAGLGLTLEEVRNAMHPMKSALVVQKTEGMRRNPDLWIDPVDGWVFPELGSGEKGECIDNIRWNI